LLPFGGNRSSWDLAQSVAQLRAATETDVGFGGFVEGDQLVLTALLGNRGESLRNLTIFAGDGVGGRVLANGRPVWVTDYLTATGITHRYDAAVREEGLRSMLAVPVRSATGVGAVLYAATRQKVPMGDRMLDRARAVARRAEIDRAVADEVDRRIDELREARLDPDRAVREQCLRDVHSELTLLRERAGSELRPRLEALLTQVSRVTGLAGPGTGGRSVKLTLRQLDVLTQIATGATNAETAERLGLSPATVKTYLQDASKRLGARNRVEAVTIARRAGLLP
jgi:DNA-binding CsgD family transcriptional regulator